MTGLWKKWKAAMKLEKILIGVGDRRTHNADGADGENACLTAYIRDTMQMSPEELTEKLSRQCMVVGVRCGYNL